MNYSLEKISNYSEILRFILETEKTISRKKINEYLRLFSKITAINKKPIKYKIINNIPRLVLSWNHFEDRTEFCPFCGETHFHKEFENDWLRSPACHTLFSLESVTADDGTILYQKDGYWVEL